MEQQNLAVYLRTSLEDYGKAHRLIDQSFSIVNQRKLIQDYISAHDELQHYHVVEYIDDGFTGTNMERPRFQNMIEDVKNGRIACIIVKDLSRLGRNYLEVGDCLERILPINGVRLVSVNDCYDSNNLIGTTGGLDIAFRNFIYDSYSKDLSVKVRSAMYTRMENGKFVNHPPFGYTKDVGDKHRMVLDSETAPIVREIFQGIIEGMSTSEVAKMLNERGTPTPLQYKHHKIKPACQERVLLWSHVTIVNIIKNYKYTGAMINHTRESRYLRDPNQRRTNRDEWIITEGAHEAIVTKEEFDLANEKLRHPKKCEHHAGNRGDNVFYCGYCGRKLQKTFGNDVYFSCCTHKYVDDAPCRNLKWSKSALEAVLLPVYRLQIALIGETLNKFQRQPPTAHMTDYASRLTRIEQDLASCDKQKMQMFESYHDGQIDLETFLSRKEEIMERQSRLREDRAAAEREFEQAKQEDTARTAEVEGLKCFLRGGALPEDQVVAYMYDDIERVIVKDDKHLEIRWKFDDFLQAAMKDLGIPA